MFNGGTVNFTENRKALHYLLRSYEKNLSGHVDPEKQLIKEQLTTMKELVSKVKNTPPILDKVPERVNSLIFSRITLIPIILATSGLSPIKSKFSPNLCRFSNSHITIEIKIAHKIWTGKNCSILPTKKL